MIKICLVLLTFLAHSAEEELEDVPAFEAGTGFGGAEEDNDQEGMQVEANEEAVQELKDEETAAPNNKRKASRMSDFKWKDSLGQKFRRRVKKFTHWGRRRYFF